MSNKPGFFSLLAESQRRKESIRRGPERRTSGTATPIPERNRSSPNIATENQNRTSSSTATPSGSSSSTISLAVPALGSSTSWTWFEQKNASEFMGLTAVHDVAISLYTRLVEADYMDSAEVAWDELCTAREELQTALDGTASPDEHLRFKAVRTLGVIYGQLGDYDRAQSILQSLCPSLPLDRTVFVDLHAWHKIDALLYYLRFLAWTSRDLDRAEIAARILPWASVDVLRSDDRKLAALFSLIRILNCKGRHEDASRHLEIFALMSPPAVPLDSEYLLEKAIAATGEGSQSEALCLFVDSMVLSSVNSGAWHRQTLNTLYHFGRALKAWNRHEPALKLLENCCKGLYYTLGASHPCSTRAYDELKAYEGAATVMQSLHRFGHTQHSRKRMWSMAYEHNYLITPIAPLKPLVAIDYERITRTLKENLALKGISDGARFDTQRNLAWCAFEQGKLNEASTALYDLYHSVDSTSSTIVGVEAYSATLASDEAICSAESTNLGVEFTRRRSKLVYLGFEKFPKWRNHQVKAILRRMTTYGLTHFTRDIIFSDPPLIIETNRESLGSGSSGTVDTVKVGEAFYARKSISLPRQQQHRNRRREVIQKEVQIIHALDHPHVVRVLLTYEEARRFVIIMHPLAECDLETFLSNKTCDTTRERLLIWKWMACLANTLAFIHSKDIRHKDIKPQNVLVKGEKVYFTDFGSGHVFNDGGNSTTDGPASGHTIAYCAPEVIKNDNRNRSSDIFSLGCVLLEMAVWSSDIPISNYFKGIRADRAGTDAVQYHDSTSRIKSWFENTPQLTQRTKDIYSEVLVHMIRRKPDMRWTAVEVCCAISRHVPSAECVKCGIDLWVPDSVAAQ